MKYLYILLGLVRNHSTINESSSFYVYKSTKRNNYTLLYLMVFLGLCLILGSCKKLVEVNAPPTSLSSGNVYAADATATSVLTGLYGNLSNTGNYSGNHGFTTFSLYCALSADEMILYDFSNTNYLSYFTNNLSTSAGGTFWGIYSYVFVCNSAIEGLNASVTLTPVVKQQLLGEAKFMRAYFYFYLTNLYGDVPLVLSSDYKANETLARSTQADVYKQIIADLLDAQKLLSTNYVDATLINSTTERVRPTTWAATALLARVYLYTKDWVDAEKQSTLIINNTSQYSLNSLDGAFLKNNSEAIWQLQPVSASVTNTWDGNQFIIPSTGPSTAYPVYLSNYLLNAFEPNDQRKLHWVSSIKASGITYYFPYKYKVYVTNADVTEYLMLLRLGEQYLIRAEARAMQNNVGGAQADINTIRNRAGLPNTTASNQSSLATAILHERQVELFTEMGQRWMDLKRTGNIDAVMQTVCPSKDNSSWKTTQQLYPLPLSDIQADPNLKQNPGY